jgi:hypothetical protein
VRLDDCRIRRSIESEFPYVEPVSELAAGTSRLIDMMRGAIRRRWPALAMIRQRT